MSEIKLIKAEYTGICRRPMLYYWECSMCGEEFTTSRVTQNGLCNKCEKEYYEKTIKENKAKAEKKIYDKVVARLKKAQFSFGDIPSITVNGEKYYQAKAIREAIGNAIDYPISEEKERG